MDIQIMIHETAIVETDHIGEGTKVWCYSHISKDVYIGKDCVIGEGVYIGPSVVIGDNCKIQNHSLIYEGVHLGNNVFIGPNVVTTNDLFPKATGSWTLVNTYIEDGASVCANSTIICGVTLNKGCMVGAGSVVTQDVNANEVVVGNPARFLRRIK